MACVHAGCSPGAELVDQWKETVLVSAGRRGLLQRRQSGPMPTASTSFHCRTCLNISPTRSPSPRGFPGYSRAGWPPFCWRRCRTCGRIPAISSLLTIAATSTKTVLPTSWARRGLASNSCRRPCRPRQLGRRAVARSKPGRACSMSPAPRPRPAGPASRHAACSIFRRCSTRCAAPARRSAPWKRRPLGIMGSSIAACWTQLELEGKRGFLRRRGSEPHRHQLMRPPDRGAGRGAGRAVVFIPMSVTVAHKIIERWKRTPLSIFADEPTNWAGLAPPRFVT